MKGNHKTKSKLLFKLLTFNSAYLKAIGLWVAFDEDISMSLGADVMKKSTMPANQATNDDLWQHKLVDGGYLVSGHRTASSRRARGGRHYVTAALPTITRPLNGLHSLVTHQVEYAF